MNSRRGYILIWTLQGLLLVIAALMVLTDLRRVNCRYKRFVAQRLFAHYLAEGTTCEATDIPTNGDEATLNDLGTLKTDLQRLFAGRKRAHLPEMVVSRQLKSWAGIRVVESKVSWCERHRYCSATYRLPMVP